MKPSNRKIIKRSPARTVRLINLNGLLPHPVEAESRLEADYIRRAAFLPTTTDILAQPFVVPVSARGYTPDFLQVFQAPEPKIVVEIKTRKKVAEYEDIFNRAAEFLTPKGYIFFVLSEQHLRPGKIDERALLLRRYAKACFPAEECTRVSAVLADYPCGLPIGSLCRVAQVSRDVVIHLIATKVLTTGPNLHIDDAAVVAPLQVLESNNIEAFQGWFKVSPWGSMAPPICHSGQQSNLNFTSSRK